MCVYLARILILPCSLRYTLFALCENPADNNEACSRVEIQTTDDQLIVKLTQFKLEDAHCFDPNDEAKIRAAIAAGEGGAARFEQVIRSLGHRLSKAAVPSAGGNQNQSIRKLSIEPTAAGGGEVVNPMKATSMVEVENGEVDASASI